MKTKYAPQAFNVKEIDREKHEVRFIMSTPDVDRHGERIEQGGWDFKNYLKNPVVLWGHDHSIPAIGQIIELGLVGGNTEGVVRFAYDENPLAKTVFDLVAGGYIRAVSVGFMNKKWLMDEENETITLLENELYELSVVNVPANALALAKSKGVDTGVLDGFMEIEKNASAEKASLLGVQVKADEEEGGEEGGEEVTPAPTGEEVETETAAVEGEEEAGAPEKTPEEEAEEEAVKAVEAIEVLCASTPTVIKAAISRLQKAASKDANGSENQVGTTPAPQGRVFRKHTINRVIRHMLQAVGE